MLRRYSKARSAANAPVNGDVSNNVKPPIVNANEKHIEELSKALEESQKNAKQVSNFDYTSTINLYIENLVWYIYIFIYIGVCVC